MSFVIEDVTKNQIEALARLDQAIGAVVAIVLPEPIAAAAGLLGAGIQRLVEQGFTEAQIHDQITHWFQNHSDVRARVARLSISLVPAPDAPQKKL